MTTSQHHDTARAMGKRAGEAARETGIPAGHEPFNTEATKDLHRTWASAYVTATSRKP